MKTFTIDSENNITVHASRKAARETGLGAFASEEQFADLIGPDNKRLVEIWNSLPGVKPVTKFANRKSATERIWKALQSLGEAAAAPVPETPFDAPEAGAAPAKLPVAEPEPVKDSRPLEDATLQTEIEPIALTAPAAGERAEPAANAGAQEPQGALAEGAATETPFTRVIPLASSGASNPLSAASTASLRTAVIRTLMETAPSPRASSATRQALTAAFVNPGRGSRPYHSKNSSSPRLYTRRVIGDETLSSWGTGSPFGRRRRC